MVNSDKYWIVNEESLFRVQVSREDWESKDDTELSDFLIRALNHYVKENPELEDFQRLPYEYKTLYLINLFYHYTNHKGPLYFFYTNKDKLDCLVNGMEYCKFRKMIRWFHGLKRYAKRLKESENYKYEEYEVANPEFYLFGIVNRFFWDEKPLEKIVRLIKKSPDKFLTIN